MTDVERIPAAPGRRAPHFGGQLPRVARWACVGLLGLAAALSPGFTGATTVSLRGEGVTTPTGNLGGVNGLELKVDDAPYSFTWPGNVVETDWLLDSTFVVDGLAVGAPTGSKGTASFFNGHGDSIDLDLIGVPTGGGPGFVVMHLGYTITGGTGRFALARGSGFEDVTITVGAGAGFPFSGAGQLEIPEPGAAWLLLAGLTALVARGDDRRRGRRAGRADPPLARA